VVSLINWAANFFLLAAKTLIFNASLMLKTLDLRRPGIDWGFSVKNSTGSGGWVMISLCLKRGSPKRKEGHGRIFWFVNVMQIS
jgi:hypothetical protein